MKGFWVSIYKIYSVLPSVVKNKKIIEINIRIILFYRRPKKMYSIHSRVVIKHVLRCNYYITITDAYDYYYRISSQKN